MAHPACGDYPHCHRMDGYVKLNGKTVWKSAWCTETEKAQRGINLLIIQPDLCVVQEQRRFDTHGWGLSSRELRAFIKYIEYEYMVGVTADEPVYRLDEDVKELIEDVFFLDVKDVMFRGAFAFVTKKGSRIHSVGAITNICAAGPSLTYYIPVSTPGSNYTVL